VVVVEEFVARVFKGGKVTVPKRLRELLRALAGKVEQGLYLWRHVYFLGEKIGNRSGS